ncbi:hypothetical protein CERZMDRAFT_115848 [Cercospora zeae-maydis SCOH1-5]|uniref:Amidase domain-containing protein n=1 Tax=Cercospora zeae-maydis SCOH1-5 TaxID=717836 RepID=A0A6A6EYK1_9PEZI|nr:hypothetical protein CERZMDRAFT_115848 [Cercospora zeae-maydis SCOH1-5]
MSIVSLSNTSSVSKHVQDVSDYVPLQLRPLATTKTRVYSFPTPADNPYNAWSHRCDLCATSPTRDRLEGRTVAIKDNICVGGLPTTLGVPANLLSDKNEYPVSAIDATVVSRILAAGVVIKGTSTCECFCASLLSYTPASGPVHNPPIHGYTSGGSSSGSCALVAALSLYPGRPDATGETVELAIGSDQAGSVRIPASFCGLLGPKPTFGLIPYTGAASMSPMIDHLGCIATDLKEIATLLEVMAGYSCIDSRMSPESPMVGDFPGISPEVRNTVKRAALQSFGAAGSKVTEVSIPMHREGLVIWTAATGPSIWPMSQETYDSITSTNPALANIIFSGHFTRDNLPSAIEAKAHRKAFELREAYGSALENVDILIMPCALTVTMPHPSITESADHSSIMERLEAAIGVTSDTCPFNVTGHPAVNVPCGLGTAPLSPGLRLPIGMQIVGKRWCDDNVIMAAAVFQRGLTLDCRSRGSPGQKAMCSPNVIESNGTQGYDSSSFSIAACNHFAFSRFVAESAKFLPIEVIAFNPTRICACICGNAVASVKLSEVDIGVT